MVQYIPSRDDWGDAGRAAGKNIVEGYKNRADESAIQNAIKGLGEKPSARDVLDAITGTKTYSPESKQTALQNYIGIEKFEELQRHAKAQEKINEDKNAIQLNKASNQSPEEKKKSFDNFVVRGYSADEAQAMTSPYVTDGVKQNISRSVEDEIARGIRKAPQASAVPGEPAVSNTQADQAPPTQEAPSPVTPVTPVTPPPKKEQEWPDIPAPSDMKPAEKVKWRESNVKTNTKELKAAKDKARAAQDARIHYKRLTDLNDTGKVQNGFGRTLIDADTGEPYKDIQKLGFVNKETQEYVKTLNDFISQAKNFFGARVTNFDLTSFKSRLPSLMNTEDGRRAIIEQMSLLSELQNIYDDTLAQGIKHYGGNANYIDISKEVDAKVEQKERGIIDKINNLDTATKWLDKMATTPKYKDTQLMFNQGNPQKQFIAVRPDMIQAAEKQGYTLWRNKL